MIAFTESIVEDAALAWLESLGYAILYGPGIAAGEPAAERADHGRVEIDQQLRDTLLPKLISSVLRGKDAESIAEATA